MAKNKFVLNHGGVGELLKSAAMQSILEEHASEIRKSAGDGYAQDTYVGKSRVNASVYADSYKARRDNLKNNTLLKAVH